MALNKIKVNDTTTVNTGVVYDISKTTGQSYDTLSAALGTNGNNVPLEIREGGMTVRFVLTSDNKYVQFRCMAQSFTTDVTQWQGVDDEPIAQSNGIAGSAGVAESIAPAAHIVGTITSGRIVFYYDNPITMDIITFCRNNNNCTIGGLIFVRDDDTNISIVSDLTQDVIIPATTKKILVAGDENTVVDIDLINKTNLLGQSIIQGSAISTNATNIATNTENITKLGNLVNTEDITSIYRKRFVPIADGILYDALLLPKWCKHFSIRITGSFAEVDNHIYVQGIASDESFIGNAIGYTLGSGDFDFSLNNHNLGSLNNVCYYRILFMNMAAQKSDLTISKVCVDRPTQAMFVDAINNEKFDYVQKVITVKADGTVGTDCDFTDIKSALDSISDSSIRLRYIIEVKNGTYDISNSADFYLGIKNYVTIHGESKTGVKVINRKSTFNTKNAVFDPAFYQIPIDYAKIDNMTLIVDKGKSPIHADSGYNSGIAYGGTIFFENLFLINENTESDTHYHGGINIGLRNGQNFVCKNCAGNVYIYAHNIASSEFDENGGTLTIDSCNVLWCGYWDLGSKAKEKFVVRNTKAEYVKVVNSGAVIPEIEDNNTIGYYMVDGFTNMPICTNIHRYVKNYGSTINKGNFVSLKDVTPSAAIEGFYEHDYGIDNYDASNMRIGFTLDDFYANGYGVIQTSGTIPISAGTFAVGDYVKLDSNGNPIAGTMADNIGIITSIDTMGAWLRLNNSTFC